MFVKNYHAVLCVLLLLTPLAHASPLLWEPVAKPTAVESTMPGWAQKPKTDQPVTRVNMRLSRLTQLAVGDRVSVAADGDRQFEFLITDKVRYANGDSGFVGDMPSARQPSSLVLTLGEDLVLAYIATSEGNFVLQAQGETGWVAAERDMHKPLSSDLRHKHVGSHSHTKTASPLVNGEAAHLNADPNNTEIVVVDVFAAYETASFPASVMESRINHLFAIGNQILANSMVHMQIRPSGYLEMDITPSIRNALSDVIAAYQNGSQQLAEKAYASGADMIAGFLHSTLGGDICGTTNSAVIGNAEWGVLRQYDVAISVSDVSCQGMILVHELAHIMGLAHSRKTETEGFYYPFGLGHGVAGEFLTTMTYEDNFDNALRVPVFSNPYLWCGDYRCGVPRDQPNSADAAYALNAVRFQAADLLEENPDLTLFDEALQAVSDETLRSCLAYQRDQRGYTYAGQLRQLSCATSIQSYSGLDRFSNIRDMNLTSLASADADNLAPLEHLAFLQVDKYEGNSIDFVFSLKDSLASFKMPTAFSTYCWQWDYLESWGSLKQLLRPPVCDDSTDREDFDNDGVSNIDELSQGRNPTVANNHDASRVSFAYASHGVFEEEGSLTLSVKRSGNLKEGVSVQVDSLDDTAEAGSDYQPVSQVLTFVEDESEKTLTLDIYNDATPAGDKSFSLALSNPQGGGELGSQAATTVTIYDSDNKSRIQAASSPVQWHGLVLRPDIREGSFTARVVRSWKAPADAYSIRVTSVGSDNAVEGEDFFIDPSVVEFASDDNEKSVVIRMLREGELDSLSLKLENADPGSDAFIAGTLGVYPQGYFNSEEGELPDPPVEQPPVEEPPVEEEPPTAEEPPIVEEPPVEEEPPVTEEPPAVPEPPAQAPSSGSSGGGGALSLWQLLLLLGVLGFHRRRVLALSMTRKNQL